MKKRIIALILSFLIISATLTSLAVTSSAVSGSLFWPVSSQYNPSSSISQGFVGGNGHRGIDITGDGIYGQPIYAVADGTVHRAQWIQYEGDTTGGYGYCIILYHPSLGIYSLYAHCSSFAVSAGSSVKEGDVIAYVGSTGNSTGAHVHFELLSYYNLTNSDALINPTPGVVYNYHFTTTYTVSYNANGGSGAPGAQTMNNGYALNISSTIPTRSGYTFLGWATSASGTPLYYAGSKYTASASVTLYAIWKKIDTPTLKNTAIHNNNEYSYYFGWMTWNDAEAWCENNGGHLATIASEEEENFVYNLSNKTSIWLGASDAEKDGTWKWVTGESFTYTNWYPDEPNNSGGYYGREDYLSINSSHGKWNDSTPISTAVVGFVLEKENIHTDTNHLWGEWETTKEATCTEEGLRTHTCTVCGVTGSEIISTIEHDYVVTVREATCTEGACKVFECSMCHDTYSEPLSGDDIWSEWSEEYPEGFDESKIEQRIEYRKAIKEFKDSTAESYIPGWEKYDSKTTYSSWSDNQSTTSKPTVSDTLRIVEQSTVYNYSHWCGQSYDGRSDNIDSIQYGSGGYHHYTTTKNQSEFSVVSGFGDKGGKTAYYSSSHPCQHNWYYWFYDGATTTYIYQTRTKTVTNYFYRWGEFGDWTTEEITPDDNTKVETRTVYRVVSVNTEPLGHDWGEWSGSTATCTENGVKTRTCARCGEVETETTYATGHTFGAWSGTYPTCTEDGVITRTCTICGEVETETTPALGHRWGEWSESTATCTEDGERTRICDRCGEEESEIIPATGHNWGETKVLRAPTCTVRGVGTHTCANCGKTETVVIPAGHVWADWTVTTEPTCTEAGEQTRVCTVCGLEETEVIEALGHNWGEWTVTKEATYNENGEQSRECARCREVETAVIPMLICEHEWAEWAVTVAPTCTENGERLRACSNCGEIETEVIPATGHTWAEWAVTKEADCVEQGERTRVCTVCGDEEIEYIDALGHSWGDWTIVSEATETEDGERVRVCSRCDAFESEVIPAAGEEQDALKYSIENYTFTLHNATGLNYIRYAPDPNGVLTTTGAIKNAEGMVAVRSTYINANRTADGELSFEVISGGVYSFWFRFDSGAEVVLTAVDINNFTPAIVSKDGPKLGIGNLYGVKDFFLVRGHVTSYSEIKNGTGRIVRYTNTTIGTRKVINYGIPTHALDANNEYTLYVRYEDTSKADYYTYFTLELPEPELTVNGLRIWVTGLEGLKTIRTAPGHLTTTNAIKNAVGTRNFSAKSFLSGGRTEMGIQYRTDGEYSLACVYKNGYEKIFNFTIHHLEPTIVLGDHSITFGDLDQLDIIRYAPGHITEPGSIKTVAGARYLKAAAIDANGEITISNLQSGEYTFLVQYTEESQNMYYFTFE